jgi:probable biosynthetic protein (TIGR04098 family)
VPLAWSGESSAPGAREPEALTLALARAIPGFTRPDYGKGWEELGLDSFDLLSLRLAVEDALGGELADADWVAAATPADLLALATRRTPAGGAPAQRPSLRRTVELGMPEMALCGLSESWLLKALGDLHWQLVGTALGCRPSEIADSFGHRLYPAFTRLHFVSSQPIASYEEGETLSFDATLSRFGAGIFFSAIRVVGAQGRSIDARLMSSFAYRGDGGGNGGLVRGQPSLADDDALPSLAAMPPFGERYRERRRERDAVKPILARRVYELIPQHDINGVGLLYYAAYPLIADICQMRGSEQGAAWAAATSTMERDICYFANADVDAHLEWRLHRDEAGDGLATEASIVRDDGVVMALVTSRKASL